MEPFSYSFLQRVSGGGGSPSSAWANVEDYGAVGNGGPDDGPAFQAACDAVAASPAFGGCVFVPPALSGAGFRIDTTVQVPPYVSLFGLGMASRCFSTSPTLHMFQFGPAGGSTNLRIADIALYRTVPRTTGYDIWITGIDSWLSRVVSGAIYAWGGDLRFEGVSVDNSHIVLENADRSVWSNCSIYGAPAGFSGLTLINCRDNMFSNVVVTQPARHGIVLQGSSRNTFVGCKVENASYLDPGDPGYAASHVYDGVSLDATSHDNKFLGGAAVNHIYYDSSTYEAHARYGVNITAGASRNHFDGFYVGQQHTARWNDAGTDTSIVQAYDNSGVLQTRLSALLRLATSASAYTYLKANNGGLEVGSDAFALWVLTQNMFGGTTYGGMQALGGMDFRELAIQAGSGKGIYFFPNATTSSPAAGVSSAGHLETSGKLLATSGLGVGNSAAATTPGSVVRKMEVFNAAGVSLGFVPIYDAIT